MAQVVDHLPSKYKALSSNHLTHYLEQALTQGRTLAQSSAASAYMPLEPEDSLPQEPEVG
jgi:hypothetical protein